VTLMKGLLRAVLFVDMFVSPIEFSKWLDTSCGEMFPRRSEVSTLLTNTHSLTRNGWSQAKAERIVLESSAPLRSQAHRQAVAHLRLTQLRHEKYL